MTTRTVKQNGTAQYTTITAAVAAAAVGDTILIQDSGTYTGAINLTSYIGGGWLKLVHVEADTGCSPTWDGLSAANAPCINLAAPLQGFIYGQIMRIKGINFANWTANWGGGAGVFWVQAMQVLQLERCTFTNCPGPTINYARGNAGAHCILDRCTWRNSGTPVFCNAAQADRYIDHLNCDIYTNANAHGIDLYWAESTAYHCTVVTRNGNNFHGIQAGTVRNCIVRNRAGNSGSNGIKAATVVSNSIVYGTWAAAYTGTQGASCLTSDPKFVDEANLDFHVAADSPALNAGVDVGIAIDRDGNARPAGAGYDIGAYERLASVTGAVCTDENTVRVTFSAGQSVTSQLTDPASYILAQVAPANGVLPTISAVTPEAGGSPTYVDLTTTEHTNGQAYSVTVSGIPGLAGSAQYTGIGTAPTVASAEVLAPDLVRVHFSEAMTPDAALLSVNSYGLIPLDGATDVSPPFVISITPENETNPTYVDLAIGGGRRNTHYTLRVRA